MGSEMCIRDSAGSAFLAALGKSLGESLNAAVASGDFPAAEIWYRASGAVIACIRMGAGRLHVLLDDAALAHIAGPSTPPSMSPVMPCTPESLTAGSIVSLVVSMGVASLSLVELAGLGVGDVIALDQPLELPFPLTTSAGAPVCRARLRSERQRLILVLSP